MSISNDPDTAAKKIERLRARNTELEKLAESALQTQAALKERIKELNCLYGLARLTEQTDITEEELFMSLVDSIPPAWQYPDITCARILYEDKEYKTGNFRETDWKLRSKIVVDEKYRGSLEVFYLEEMPRSDEGPFLREERYLIDTITRNLSQFLKRRDNDSKLRRIEWMLRAGEPGKEDYVPEYGDLSSLNQKGQILSLIGKEQLRDIASEYLNLLESSAAIYERNGDYALGLFSSGWCRMMDVASRKLCGTRDNRKALKSGKWLCHESCWTDSSLKSIDTGKPVDVECNGGIRLYAVPVHVQGKIAGAINFGYGTPPREDEKLRELSGNYKIPVEELRKQSEAYQARPEFIIDYAKKRIRKSALLLGDMIEARLTRNASRETEKNLRTTLNSIGDAVITTDMQGMVTSINPVAEKLTGWKFHRAVNRPLEKIFRISDTRTGKTAENPLKMVLKTGTVRGLANHTKLISKNGKEYQIADSGSPIKNSRGQITGMVMVFRDVSDEYRVRKELEESEKKFRTAVYNAPFPAMIQADDREVILVNKAWEEISGYSGDEIKSVDQWISLAYREKKSSVIRDINRLYKLNKRKDEGEYEIITKLGEKRYWLFSSAPLGKSAEGRQLVISMAMDITELKHSETAGRESEKKYRTVFENTGAATCMIEKDGTISLANNKFASLAGYPIEEIQNKKTWMEFVVREDLERMLEQHQLRRKNKDRALREYEFRFMDRNRNIKQIHLFIDMIPGTDTSVASLLDITERNRAEQELRNIKNELKKLVESKTKQLKKRIGELERFREATIEREFRIKELRDEIDRLKKKNDACN